MTAKEEFKKISADNEFKRLVDICIDRFIWFFIGAGAVVGIALLRSIF